MNLPEIKIRPDPSFTVRICLLSKTGRLLYFVEETETVDFNKKIGGVNYQIRKEGLYEFDPWLYKSLYWWLNNHKEFWILFNEGEPDPISPSNPKISPYELYIINNSTAMQKGISDYLKSNPIGGRTSFIILILGLILLYILSQYGGVRLF